jgi:hypothetical protein
MHQSNISVQIKTFDRLVNVELKSVNNVVKLSSCLGSGLAGSISWHPRSDDVKPIDFSHVIVYK